MGAGIGPAPQARKGACVILPRERLFHCDHELADRAAVFELGDGLMRAFDRIGFADQRIDLARLPQVEQFLDIALIALGLARGCSGSDGRNP